MDVSLANVKAREASITVERITVKTKDYIRNPEHLNDDREHEFTIRDDTFGIRVEHESGIKIIVEIVGGKVRIIALEPNQDEQDPEAMRHEMRANPYVPKKDQIGAY